MYNLHSPILENVNNEKLVVVVNKHNLTLDRPAEYQIKVPGDLKELLSNWSMTMEVEVEEVFSDLVITNLLIEIDQAGLQGLLRRLYSLGLPLILVKCIDFY